MSQATFHLEHPFFSPSSLYRLATQGLVWHDGGRQSIAAHFEALRRKELHEEWADQTPAEQDWGLGTEANAALHRELLRSRKSANRAGAASAAAKTEQPVGHWAGPLQCPGLFRFDLTKPLVEPIAEFAPDFLFTGCGRERRGTISEFVVNVPKVPDGHRCLVLLFANRLLESAISLAMESHSAITPAQLPSSVRVNNEMQAAKALTTLLQMKSLEPGLDTPVGSRRRMSRLASMLALAPGLEGTAQGGRFQARVSLPRPGPGLELDTWVVLCIGPKAAS